MSYNGSGTYVPPAGQPVATGTVIQSATFNTLVTDIGNTFNNVLPRDGQAPMQGQLKITDGTSAVPGIAFNSEASSGMFRPTQGALALVASGVENLRINSAGRIMIGTTTDDGTNKLQVNGPAKVTGSVSATSFIGDLTGNAASAARLANARTINGVAFDGTANISLFTPLSGSDGTSYKLASGVNLNDVNQTGFFRGDSLGNAPYGSKDWFYVVHEQHDGTWCKQTATSYGSGGPSGETYQRTKVNNNWSAWIQVSDGVYGTEYAVKRRKARYSPLDNTSIGTIRSPEIGFDYDTGGAGVSGPFIHFGGLDSGSGNATYGCQMVAAYNNGNVIKFRTRNDDNNVWNTWKEFWHTGNLNVQQGPTGGSVPLRTGEGYLMGNYISMSDDGTTDNTNNVPITGIITKKGDNYYRHGTAAQVRTYLDLANVTNGSVFRYRGEIADSSMDSALEHGAYLRTYPGASASTLVWNVNGSAGAVQLDVMYDGTTRMRNKVDNLNWTGWRTMLHNGNVGAYAPTLTGGGASGNWPINITGTSNRAQSIVADGNTMTFHWQGQGGQPTWLWGAPGANDAYVYNPSNFSVNFANAASDATSIYSAVSKQYTWTALQAFVTNTGQGSHAGFNNWNLRAASSDGGAAAMTFIREGQYAINMGLDSDNVFRIGGFSAAASRLQMDMSGNLTMAGNVTAYSDERLKQNWRAVQDDFVTKWAQVKSGIYDRIDSGETQAGVSAQSMQQVLPEAVAEQADGYLAVNYGAGAAIASVEIAKEVVALRDQLAQALEVIEVLKKKVGLE